MKGRRYHPEVYSNMIHIIIVIIMITAMVVMMRMVIVLVKGMIRYEVIKMLHGVVQLVRRNKRNITTTATATEIIVRSMAQFLLEMILIL
jgi:hypothetical protein